jgi:hypothetical protein
MHGSGGMNRRLAVLAAGLFAMPVSAFAQTTQCPVPYLLQNGTIADASQVMTNLNTLSACAGTVPLVITMSGTPPLGHGLTIDLATTISGVNATKPTTANLLHGINNGVQGGNNFTSTLLVEHEFGGSTVTGGQNSLEVDGYFNGGATSTGNTNRNYVGVFAQMVAFNGDGGTDPTMAATSKGGIFGMNPFGDAKVGIAFANVSGGEVNVALEPGTSALEKTGLQIVDHALDQVHGSYIDAALAIGGQIGSIGFNNGILFSNGNGGNPFTATACLICTTLNTVTVATGVDISQYNITGFAWKSNGAFITGAGALSGIALTLTGANPGTLQPSQAHGSFISSNYTSGGNEVDYFNMVDNAGGHNFYQKTGASTAVLLASLGTTGLNIMMGGVVAPGGYSMTLTTEPDTGPCAAGQMAWDVNYIYVCSSTNVFKRVALSSY